MNTMCLNALLIIWFDHYQPPSSAFPPLKKCSMTYRNREDDVINFHVFIKSIGNYQHSIILLFIAPSHATFLSISKQFFRHKIIFLQMF